jgi:nitrous oxidase accessory protein NosD
MGDFRLIERKSPLSEARNSPMILIQRKMMTYPDRPALALAASLLAVCLFLPDLAGAESCGEKIRRCGCGDKVVVSTRLDYDIGTCSDTGLEVASGVTLDCGGHRIVGRSNRDGILMRFAVGSRVRNCEVSGFRLGIRVRAGESQLITDNIVIGNRRGISVGEQAKRTRVESNRVEGSREIGILVNPDTSRVQLSNNLISYSGKENIEIRQSQQLTISGNILTGRPRYDLRLTDTHGATIRGNRMQGGKVQVRGDSDENLFSDNDLSGRYAFDFRGSEDRDGHWRGPDRNRVTGGSILNARPCFRLAGTTQTIVEDVVFGECSSRPADQKTVDGHASWGNEIEGIASQEVRPKENCGRNAPCRCGSTVAESVTLTEDLVGCSKFGLKLAESVTLDCAGHEIVGRGSDDGLRLIGTRNVRIRNCTIRNFKNGMRLGNTNSVLVTNNQFDGNRVGIRMDTATTDISIEGNTIRRSRDQGILVAAPAEDFRVVGNEFHESGREHIDLRRSEGALLDRNVFSGRVRDAMRLTDVRESLIRDNRIERAGIDLRGASTENRFLDNLLLDDGFEFRGIEERSGPWRFPDNNRIDGGAIPNARRCFLIRGASGNHIHNVDLGECSERPFDLKRVDGHVPTDNTID